MCSRTWPKASKWEWREQAIVGGVLGEMAGPHLCHRDELGCGSEVGWGELLQLGVM